MARPPRQNPRQLASNLLRTINHGTRLPEPRPIETAFLPFGLGIEWKAAADLQRAPRIPRPNTWQSFIPVIGSGWEALGDLQDANYGGAVLNTGFAVADALPAATAVKGGRAAVKLAGGTLKAGKAINVGRTIKVLRGDLKTANTVTRRMHKVGLADKGEQVHHVFELNGTPRNVPSLKNSYPFLKSLPEETHQRIHRMWNGKPRFGPVARAWHGTTDWMKTGTVGLLGQVGKIAEHTMPPSHMNNPANKPGERP
jgi:hypothetical protein